MPLLAAVHAQHIVSALHSFNEKLSSNVGEVGGCRGPWVLDHKSCGGGRMPWHDTELLKTSNSRNKGLTLLSPGLMSMPVGDIGASKKRGCPLSHIFIQSRTFTVSSKFSAALLAWTGGIAVEVVATERL